MKFISNLSNAGKKLYLLLLFQIVVALSLYGTAIYHYMSPQGELGWLVISVICISLGWVLLAPFWSVMQYHMRPVSKPEHGPAGESLSSERWEAFAWWQSMCHDSPATAHYRQCEVVRAKKYAQPSRRLSRGSSPSVLTHDRLPVCSIPPVFFRTMISMVCSLQMPAWTLMCLYSATCVDWCLWFNRISCD